MFIYILYRPRWVKSGGILYKKPAAVIITTSEDSMPVFGKLDDILIINNQVYFIVDLLTTIGFSIHFNAYIVDGRNKDSLILVQ